MATLVTSGQRAVMARVWPFLALLLAMVSVQYGATFAKGLFPAVGAQGATALRLGLGAMIFGVVLRPWRTRVSPRAVPALLGYGVSLGLMNLTFYMALRSIPLGLAVALEFTGPLMVAVFASRRALDFLWIALAFTGILFLLPLAGGAHKADLTGVLYALAAGAGWAAYSVFGQKTGAAHGAAVPAMGTAIGALIAVPVGIFHAGPALFAPAILLSALVVAVFSCAIPFTLEMVALVGMPSQVYGTVTSVEPAIGAIAGLVFLHEHLTVVQVAAIGAIMVASVGTAAAAKPSVPAGA